MKKTVLRAWLPFLLALTLLLSSCGDLLNFRFGWQSEEQTEPVALSDVPSYREDAYIAVNGNVPFFTDEEKASATSSFETYSNLDSLNRCGVATASVGRDLMPSDKREGIGSVKPSGWQTVKYDIVDGQYLYNRCHLIGYQLTGENANKQNLITGTRYLNVIGMLPFENMVADYVKETGNHVLYRVTPIFNGNDLVALGVLMEGWSVEDNGEGVAFCMFCYNVQPGIVIDYATGESRLAEDGEELMTMWGGTGEAQPSNGSEEIPSGEADTGDGGAAQTLALVSVTDPAVPGSPMTITVKGKANTVYSIKVTLPSGNVSEATAFHDATSDVDGNATWNWTPPSNIKTGAASVVVTGGDETLTFTFNIGQEQATAA